MANNRSTSAVVAYAALTITMGSLVSTLSFAEMDKSISGAPDSIGKNAFLSALIKNHPLFVKEDLNNSIAIQNTAASNAGQEWNLELGSQHASQETLNAQSGPDEIEQNKVTASVGRQIWASGGFLSFNAAATQGDFTNVPCEPNPDPAAGPDIACIAQSANESVESELSVTYSQPLLRNFKGRQSRSATDVSKIMELSTDLQVAEAKEQFLLTMSNEYVDWASLAAQKQINQERLNLARDQRREMEKRYRKNLVEKVDLMRLQDSERNAKQQLLLISSQFKAKAARLAVLSKNSAIRQMSADFDFYNFPKLPALGDLSVPLKTNSRNVRLLDQNIKQLQRQLITIKDGVSPELSLDLRAGLKSETQDYDAGEIDDDGQDYSVGLNFKKALGNHGAKAELQKLSYEIDKLKFEKEQVQLDLEANLNDLYIQLDDMRSILDLNTKLISSARAKTKEELKLYRQGRSDLTNVIASRDQTQGARLVYAQNALSFHKLYLQFQALNDTLLSEVQNFNKN